MSCEKFATHTSPLSTPSINFIQSCRQKISYQLCSSDMTVSVERAEEVCMVLIKLSKPVHEQSEAGTADQAGTL